MFRAVVFDMDGVITDTEKLYRRFQLEEGRKLGIPDDVNGLQAARNTRTNRGLKRWLAEGLTTWIFVQRSSGSWMHISGHMVWS